MLALNPRAVTHGRCPCRSACYLHAHLVAIVACVACPEHMRDKTSPLHPQERVLHHKAAVYLHVHLVVSS